MIKHLDLPAAERIEFKGKKAWLGLRRTGLFGSDVPAILGIDENKRPIDVFLDKKGEKVAFEGNDHTEFGNLLQKFVLNMYQKQMRYTGFEEPGLYFNKKTRYLGANPDWISSRTPRHGAECKARGFRQREHYYNGQCMLSDVAQACHYMAVLDIDRWDVCVIVGEPVLTLVELERDKDFEDMVLNRLHAFWTNLQKDIPPKDDGSDAFCDYVRKKHSAYTKKVFRKADIVEETLIAEILDLRKTIEDMQKELNIKENSLKSSIGMAQGLFGEVGKATWSRFEMKNTAWKEIALQLGATKELIDKYTTMSPSGKFTVKESPPKKEGEELQGFEEDE